MYIPFASFLQVTLAFNSMNWSNKVKITSNVRPFQKTSLTNIKIVNIKPCQDLINELITVLNVNTKQNFNEG